MKIIMNAETTMDNNIAVSEAECFQDEEILQLKAELDGLESFNDENDYKDFVANYPKLEEKSFGKFNIKFLDADNEDVVDHFSMKTENYKFIKISHK